MKDISIAMQQISLRAKLEAETQNVLDHEYKKAVQELTARAGEIICSESNNGDIIDYRTIINRKHYCSTNTPSRDIDSTSSAGYFSTDTDVQRQLGNFTMKNKQQQQKHNCKESQRYQKRKNNEITQKMSSYAKTLKAGNEISYRRQMVQTPYLMAKGTKARLFRESNAALKLQSSFRGYVTRKNILKQI